MPSSPDTVVRLLWPSRQQRGRAPRAYAVAGITLVSRRPVAALAAFAVSAPAATHDLGVDPAPPPLGASVGCFDGDAPLGDRLVRVTVDAVAAGYRVAVAGAPPFLVARDGGSIHCLGGAPEGADALLTEVLVGPVLVLALALHGTFCLHASALAVGDRAVALAGETGAGKSTIARELPALGGSAWRRIGDDILPLAIDGGTIRVEPRFPQLKLRPEEQARPSECGPLPLSALYLLAPQEVRARGGVTIEPLSPGEALAAVAGQTVAARLFDRELLDSHLAFCAALAGAVPVRRLAFPQRLDALGDLAAALEADLAG